MRLSWKRKLVGLHGLPEKVTLDKSGANKAGIDVINLKLILFFLWFSIDSNHGATNKTFK